jgi:hypothetical protein
MSTYNPEKVYAQKIEKINQLLERRTLEDKFPMIRLQQADKIDHRKALRKKAFSHRRYIL